MNKAREQMVKTQPTIPNVTQKHMAVYPPAPWISALQRMREKGTVSCANGAMAMSTQMSSSRTATVSVD
jgi:hypothetical protein